MNMKHWYSLSNWFHLVGIPLTRWNGMKVPNRDIDILFKLSSLGGRNKHWYSLIKWNLIETWIWNIDILFKLISIGRYSFLLDGIVWKSLLVTLIFCSKWVPFGSWKNHWYSLLIYLEWYSLIKWNLIETWIRNIDIRSNWVHLAGIPSYSIIEWKSLIETLIFCFNWVHLVVERNLEIPLSEEI